MNIVCHYTGSEVKTYATQAHSIQYNMYMDVNLKTFSIASHRNVIVELYKIICLCCFRFTRRSVFFWISFVHSMEWLLKRKLSILTENFQCIYRENMAVMWSKLNFLCFCSVELISYVFVLFFIYIRPSFTLLLSCIFYSVLL